MACFNVGNYLDVHNLSDQAEEQNIVEDLSIVPLEKDSFGKLYLPIRLLLAK